MEATETRPVTVLVAITRTLYRQSLAHALSIEDDIEVVGQARDIDEAAMMSSRMYPDVIVIEEQMQVRPDEFLPDLIGSRQSLIVLTHDAKRALKNRASNRIRYVAISGYLVDLVREIKDANCGTLRSPQPAALKDALQHMSSIEQYGDVLDMLLLNMSQFEAAVLVQLLHGTSPDQIARSLDTETPAVTQTIHELIGRIEFIVEAA